jgi:hypothetical protein
MSDEGVPEVLRTKWKIEAQRYPWFPGVIGSCVALRKNRLAFAVLMGPTMVLDVAKIPGTRALVRRIAPLGQLAYSRTHAALGFPSTGILEGSVDIDWIEEVRSVEIISTGWIFAEMRVNGRTIRVDRRSASALVELWAG